jgi:phage repressor protein C with HTH and peptisase S24 domain
MGLGKRIRHFREKAQLKLPQLAELSGVDVGTISALELRDSSRSQYFPMLARAFGMTVEELGDETFDPELNVEVNANTNVPSAKYILRVYPTRPEDFNEVPMFSRGPRTQEPAPRYPSMQPILSWQHEDELPDGEFVMVPRLEVHLSAGGGAGSSQVEIQFDEAQPQAFRAEWVRSQHLKPKKLAAMTARGDSMEPTIHDGDSLLVDTGQVDVADGKVYALWYEGGERVKRLYRMPGGGLRIRSDNANDFPEIMLGPEYGGHVRIIGRVVHRSGTGGL